MPAASLDFADLAERLRRITVEIAAGGASFGCGVLWPRGCVITNAHVIRRARPAVRLFDGTRLEARLVARDGDADLALLAIPDSALPVATLAHAPARVGSLVLAVGHPFGVRGALTAGIVHAVGPLVPRGRAWIQADLRLGPGNSGGPLADVAGDLVGLNAMIAGGLAIAVPVERIAEFVRGAGVATHDGGP
jgi:serine protease Do